MTRKIGLALGAGGAKGLAHIGVLQVFNREKIPVDMIAGASMGAVIGAAYAAGTDIDFLAKLACNINQAHYVDVILPKLGLLKGDKVLGIIKLLTHNKKFSELKIPFSVVATDIEKGERIVFREGELAPAIRASISIPGVFKPVQYQGRMLVDGAVTDRLPTSVLKEMGADLIIGVDVKFSNRENGEKVVINNIYDVIMQSIEILENKVFMSCLDFVDVLITPNTSKIATTDFSKAEECIELGRMAAEESLDRIKKVLEELKDMDSISAVQGQ